MSTTLYVANATKHNQIIVYRLPESTSTVRKQIAPGQQIPIKDLRVMDAEAIIQQNIVYGWTEASCVDRTRPYVGIVYALDKQIAANKIMSAVEHNNDVLVARGKQNRELAAVATNEAIERSLEANNLADLKTMSMTIEEEETKTHTAEISEHFTVDRHADAPRTETKRPSPRQQQKASRR